MVQTHSFIHSMNTDFDIPKFGRIRVRWTRSV